MLAAEQTPESSRLVPGDSRRRAAGRATLRRLRCGSLSDPRRRPSVSDGLLRSDRIAHIENRADITIAAQPVSRRRRHTDGHLPVRYRGPDRRLRGEAHARRLAEMRSSVAGGSTRCRHVAAERPFVASMGIYVFSRESLLESLQQPGVDFGKELIPRALGDLFAFNPYIFRGYWADVGTIQSFYDANVQLTQPRRAIQLLSSAVSDLHAPAVSPGHADQQCPHRQLDRDRRLFSGSLRHHRLRCRHPHAHCARSAAVAIRAARRRQLRRGACQPTRCRSVSGATPCSIASSSTRMRASETAYGW